VSEEKFILPTTKRIAPAINPGVIIIYGSPKSGKTSICAGLENALIIELEPNGADYVDAMVVEANNPPEFEKTLKAIIDGGCPYDYVIVDSVSQLDRWAEIVGTLNYMGKSQGARFNVKPGTIEKYRPSDPKFETVHELGNGVGFAHSRAQMLKWYDMIAKCAKHVVLIAHIKDKFIESKKSGDTVEASDIDLTGKVKTIYCSKADAVGHFSRRGNEGIINFNNENSIACGGRCTHLDGEIVISQKNENKTITTFWDRIYLK